MKKFGFLFLSVFFVGPAWVAAQKPDSTALEATHQKELPSKKKTKRIPLDESVVKVELKKELAGILPQEELDRIFSDQRLKLDESVVAAGATGEGAKYFDPEKGIFTNESLRDGLEYYERHEKYFVGAEAKHGVEQSAIVAILRAETNFGSFLGKRLVINSLYSLYALSARPRKRQRALDELKAFLEITKSDQRGVFGILGSTAGCFDLPQFSPSSYRDLAVDGDGDGKIDLMNDADAIFSIENYLWRSGWGKDYASKRRAILRYNNDPNYADAVLVYSSVMGAVIEVYKSTRAVTTLKN